MIDPGHLRKHQQQAVVTVALLLFQLVLVILQLWLFASSLEGILAGEFGMAAPAAAVSVVCLAVNAWMLAGIYRMQRGP